MNYFDFLNQVIDNGIVGAHRSYARPEQEFKLKGAVEGFESCRGKLPAELAELWYEAGVACNVARITPEDNRYWRWRCREAEIEWVCNVVSAAFEKSIEPILPHLPTARGVIAAAQIRGVSA